MPPKKSPKVLDPREVFYSQILNIRDSSGRKAVDSKTASRIKRQVKKGK